MSILSDRQLRVLCEAPLTKLDHFEYGRLMSAAQVTELVHYTDPSIPARRAAEREERIRQQCTIATTAEERAAFRPMISPFEASCVREVEQYIECTKPMGDPVRMVAIPVAIQRKIISYGTSSYGYDVRLTDKFKVFTNINSSEIDPKRFDESKCLVDGQVRTDADGAQYVLIPPNSYLLGETVEYFDIPRDVMVICLGKSTYARAGAIVNTTPIEPGFQGKVVIEISNSTPLPMRVYVGEGVAQFLFFQGSEPCEVSYADRNGKYMHQTGVTLSKV